MDIYQISLIGIIGIIILCILLSLVIASSTRTKAKMDLMQVQNKLLIEIAKKLGVSKEDINQALYH